MAVTYLDQKIESLVRERKPVFTDYCLIEDANLAVPPDPQIGLFEEA